MLKRLQFFVMIHLIPPLAYLFLHTLKATLRIEHINRKHFEEDRATGHNHIICFWHGRLLMMPFAIKPTKKDKILISRHRDGELIARIIHLFGPGTIRGSYRKGSISSLREIIHDMRDGITVAITPDGPKGPRCKVKEGIVELARLTGKPIIPVAFGASKKKLFIPGTSSFSPTLFQRSSFSGVIPLVLTTP